jgi:hypothetical protein
LANDQGSSSSLLQLVEDAATEIEHRARFEGAVGPVQLEVSAARGIDLRRADREFGARLRRRLRTGSVITPVAEAAVRARVLLSEERVLVWVTGTLEGGPLVAPAPFAVSRPVDRELEIALGASARRGRSRWVRTRIGAIPGGVLDVVTLDVDGEPGDEIAVVSVDGVRIYRAPAAALRPEKVSGPHPLPGGREWPRVISGWAAADAGRVWFATTRGEGFVFDPAKKTFKRSSLLGVPLKQPGGEVLLARGEPGSPTLSGPLRGNAGAVDASGLPSAFRDVVRSRFHAEAFLFVDDSGHVGAVHKGKLKRLPLADGSGDRLIVEDFDGDAEGELVTTTSASRGESDELTVWRIDAKLERAAVVVRTGLSGGAIVALTTGDTDYDGRPEIIAVEDFGTEEAVLWRVGYAP